MTSEQARLGAPLDPPEGRHATHNGLDEQVDALWGRLTVAFALLWALILTLVAVIASLILAPPARASSCETYRVTGYVRGAHSPWTYDGTSVWTREAIAAASWNVPIDARVQVDGIGTFRVADRGHLNARHIDILVDTVSEAYALTGWREVCVLS